MTFFNQEKLFDVLFLKQYVLNTTIELHSRFTKFSSRNNMENNPMQNFLMMIFKRPKGPYGTLLQTLPRRHLSPWNLDYM